MQPGLDRVDDVVDTWQDARRPSATGALTGLVTDGVTGEPLMDVNVSAGGIHVATDFAGRFSFDGLPAGTQRITVHRTLGDYRATDETAVVQAGEEAQVQISMQPAQPVPVQFEVQLPIDTPPEAEIRVVGNIFQLGALAAFRNTPPLVQDVAIPSLERVSPTVARGTFQLHEGTYLNYYYTLAGAFHGRERDTDGSELFRDAVVSAGEPTITDCVESWLVPDHQHLITLRVEVPPSTPDDTLIGAVVGPTQRLTHVAGNEWIGFFTGHPGEVIDYSISLGDTGVGRDGTPGLGPDGMRRLTVDRSRDERITVERWASGRPSRSVPEGTPVDVLVRASLPPSTATPVRLVIEGGAAAQSVELTHCPAVGFGRERSGCSRAQLLATGSNTDGPGSAQSGP